MTNKENNWIKLADKETIEKTIKNLRNNGIEAFYFESVEEAKQKILELLPENAEVMTMTSMTLETINISNEINSSKKYNSVRNKLMSMDRKTKSHEMQKLGSAPEYAVGSVHAVTEGGELVIASNTGSQLPAYAYGSKKIIFVVGTQKIVRNLDEAFKRIYEYSLVLESERARKAYGVSGSSINKILIINKEFQPDRINLIFINKNLGF